MKGAFITFEGIEGSGKSTQVLLYADYLREQGRAVTLTREPGGTRIGDQIRKILLDPGNDLLSSKAELLLYAAARAQHLEELIGPSLAAGQVVLCDRFSDATLAYQGYGRGLDLELIRSLDAIVTAGLRPHLTILLDVETSVGLSRARGRNTVQGLEAEARFENEDMAFHERVRQGYLALAQQEPHRFRIVQASLSPEEIQINVRHVIDKALGVGHGA